MPLENNAAGSSNPRPSDAEVMTFGKLLNQYCQRNGLPAGEFSDQTDFSPEALAIGFDPTIYLSFRPPTGPLQTLDLQLLGWGGTGSYVEANVRTLRALFNLSGGLQVSWDDFLKPPATPPPPPDTTLTAVGAYIPDLSTALGFPCYQVNQHALGSSLDTIAPGTRITDPRTGFQFVLYRAGMFSVVWRRVN